MTQLIRIVQEYKLDDKVEMTGFSNSPRLLMNRFTALVVPSRREGMGLVLPEAMSIKVPVVAATVGGIPEVVEHNVNGLLVEPDNPQALKKAMLRIANRELRQKLTEAAYQTWRRKFSSDVCANHHLNIYKRLLK